ncbi:methyltransferase [Dehalobacter sp. DCM]|uniref:uroporphyrinogen decarboxylase family protein n=1 Tax=Dehalobacter sp. DCM TaxID=2907827 RepID=UPI003081D44D|nr:methyltransferase [Dehalobacter sp. DCM]
MNLRENVMAIYNRKQPDYYGDLMAALEFVIDPVFERDGMIPQDGKEHKDSWGTVKMFLPGSPGAHPHLTPENIVIKDIEKWEEQLVVPTIDDLDWSKARAQAASIKRDEKLAAIFSPGGLFERSHFLMGFENALMSYMEYPDEMKALLRKIADYKIAFIRKVAEECHPDIIFYHDDWGSKQNLLLPPRVWRDIIKPLQKEIADTIHDCGMIYMHHADCICQPIVQDMVEIGVDVWQGVIAQNDIVEIQRITQGKMALVGGIDGPKIDIENITEEAIRAEVRRAIDTYCPAGRFYPSIPNGVCFREWNNQIVMDELASYGKKYAQEHPIANS